MNTAILFQLPSEHRKPPSHGRSETALRLPLHKQCFSSQSPPPLPAPPLAGPPANPPRPLASDAASSPQSAPTHPRSPSRPPPPHCGRSSRPSAPLTSSTTPPSTAPAGASRSGGTGLPAMYVLSRLVGFGLFVGAIAVSDLI